MKMKTHHPYCRKESTNEKLHFMNTRLHIFSGRHSAQYSHKPVSFFCAAPNAKLVELVGDFNHWQPFPMERSVDGWWLTRLELCHGHHRYRFLVDGQPTLDLHATGIVRDEHDERVSLIAVS